MGGKPKSFWPRKHNTLLWYVKNPDKYVFNYESIDKVPRKNFSPRTDYFKYIEGKIPTSVWEVPNIPGASKERVRYPTQKPIKLIARIINVHTNPGDLILDFFAGSGTTGEVCVSLGRDCILIDKNPESLEALKSRVDNNLINYEPE